MSKDIRTQLISMSVVLALLLILGVWQAEFVINAISANVFLNMTIFGTFFFGVVVAYKNVFSLKNEVLAFNALREDYEDATSQDAQNASDPYWRYYRCDESAVIFSKPKILEQPFQIISEEIARTGALALSTGIMQNLMDSVDDRLGEKKSLIQYVTGILVFLGLIGTFVGLMVTLGSVGDIIGGLDLSGGGGAEAIQGLMKDLQIPLQGMATGFSSSLFGLITSLTLGLMARFANQGSNIFRMSFETWLAGLAKMDSDGAQSALKGQERELSLMLRVARLAMISNTKMATSVEAIAESSNRILHAQIDSEKTNAVLANAVESLSISQINSNNTLVEVAGVLDSKEALSSMIEELHVDTERQIQTHLQVNDAVEAVVARQFELQELAQQAQENFVLRDELKGIVAGVDERMTDEFVELRKSVDGYNGVLVELDKTLGRDSAEFQIQQKELIERSTKMHDTLAVAIEKSKEAIVKADEERAAEEAKQVEIAERLSAHMSLTELQEHLESNFKKMPESEETEVEDTPKAKRKGFSFFRRSA